MRYDIVTGVTEIALACLRGIERGICPNRECNCVRPLNSHSCNRCGSRALTRPIQLGDTIIGRASCPPPELPDLRLDGNVIPERVAEDLPTGPARVSFLDRVKKLPCSTILHIPVSVRERVAEICASNVSGVSDGQGDGGFLEQIRSKLLLGRIPKNRNIKVEIAKRLDL